MPRQNGKIERLWPSLERNLRGREDVEEIQPKLNKFRENYNTVPHKTLPRKGFRPMTPRECFNEIPHWKEGDNPMWKVQLDGKVQTKEIPNH
ncbi:integrase core domain-containing protein [Trichomonas vaginalis G3]|uniref:integrase core domain-containing protein n=1 Tax=Trichomonas vaginalis (strain ATCC PRA-98 / G3) TaxID=412133 RepID=UPI0021E606A4|nr:integrase core domain-containing protein [Trichomonas vaginalis G3]KAI5545248.1 integrase core domain-containing protein [Trichomonas vaginalis G3]